MLEFLERAFLGLRNALIGKAEELKSDERGMATVEMVILIVVIVIIVGLVVNFLTRKGFELSNGDQGGLIQYLFDLIKTKLTSSLSSDE